MDLIEEIKQGSRWAGKDDFPTTDEWKAEVKKWLLFLKHERQYERFLPRLKDTPEKRDETLNEIGVAYFISEKRGYPIVEWEPRGQNDFVGEFSFQLLDKTIVFCEVKSPGWEAGIAKQDKNSPRLKQQKFINGEVMTFNNAGDIRSAVEKAYPKFRDDTPNLLVIADDLFVSLNFDKFGAEEALFYEQLKPPYSDTKPDGCFVNADFNRLSALMTFNVQQAREIEYHRKLLKNRFALLSIEEDL